MRCHVCGKEIEFSLSLSRLEDPPVLDGWAWTVAEDGSLDVVTCSNCTPKMRAVKTVQPDSLVYRAWVIARVGELVEERRVAAFAVGPGAIAGWINEALNPQDRGKRKKVAYLALYGSGAGEMSKILADGKPGPRTEAAVQQFQETFNRMVDAAEKFPEPRSGKLPIIGEAPATPERCADKPIDWWGDLKDRRCSRYTPKVEMCCAITGKPTNEMRQPPSLWETWVCRGVTMRCVCVDSPCSFEVCRRLGMNPNDTWGADGPWGEGFSREQILAWMAHPPMEFLERTEKALRAVADLYGNQCPLAQAGKACANCGKPSITLFEKSAPVPLCGVCAQVADAAGLPQAAKEEIVRLVGAGDRYAWQRLVEAQPLVRLRMSQDELRGHRRMVAAMLRESAAADRRRFLKEHPEEHLVEMLGMGDFCGPKVR